MDKNFESNVKAALERSAEIAEAQVKILAEITATLRVFSDRMDGLAARVKALEQNRPVPCE